MKNRKKYILFTIATMLFIGAIVGATTYYYLFAPQFFPQNTRYLYIGRDDTIDSVYNKVSTTGNAKNMLAFKWMSQYRKYDKHIHTGKYAINPNENVYHVFSRLYRGYQEPTNITIGSVRSIDRLARNIGQQLMIDSTEISTLLHDSIFIQSIGYNPNNIQCLFIPNTYQVYWNISAKDFIARMQKEYNRFWNEERLNKAKNIGLSPHEVSTLASIVEEETNNNAEKPIVAGLYLNRLHKGMPLQADPTIKYAIGDFTLRRITNKHLTVKSPYNTYINKGLPPGPIRIPSPIGIDAVLNHQKHNYLYMCAKEDFSGTHNFARTLSEHNQNARRYWNALNQRKIFK